jgi:hypothetical protein
MSSSFRTGFIVCSLIVLTLVAVRPAKADQYSISVVQITQDTSFSGLDDQGHAVINEDDNSYLCGEIFGGTCFEIYEPGQSPVFSVNAPALIYDNGTPCTIALDASFAPQETAHGICNNGHEVFAAVPSSGFLERAYDGPDRSDEIPGTLLDAPELLDANGDFAYIEAADNRIIYAQDLTTIATPEPDSIVLLGTGCLTLVGTLRRNLKRR